MHTVDLHDSHLGLMLMKQNQQSWGWIAGDARNSWAMKSRPDDEKEVDKQFNRRHCECTCEQNLRIESAPLIWRSDLWKRAPKWGSSTPFELTNYGNIN